MIAHAKVKTDTIDATVLAKLYASGFLLEGWVPDPGALPSEDRSPGGHSSSPAFASEEPDPVNPPRHLIPSCPHGNLVGIAGANG